MPSCTIVETEINETRGPGDTIVYTYQADLGEVIRNPVTALNMARSLGPHPLPSTRTHFTGTSLWCNSVSGKRTKENRNVWIYTVTFGQLPAGEDEEQQSENPLLRAPVYGVRNIEQEYVVKQARNVQALGVQFAAGGPYRAAGTLGPIVNGAGRRPDEPIMRTRRGAVIVIEKNYPSLGQIMSLNENFQDTTNSDSLTLGGHTFDPRRLKYEQTQEGGRQEQNGVVFYPGVTEISIHKTTDLILDNVGFEYYNALSGVLTRAKDEAGDDTAEPVNLKLNGTLLEDGTTQITYRDLEPVSYAGFFS